MKRENIPAALATSTNRKKAMGYLDMANVTEYFSASVCGDEVKAAKPAGEYLHSCGRGTGSFDREMSCFGRQPKWSEGCKKMLAAKRL